MNDKCQLIFQALSDKTRQKILEMLKDKELCVMAICKCFDMRQPSISHHLNILKRAGLVKCCKKGKEVHYTLNRCTLINCCCVLFNKFDLKPKKSK
ncbi:MAG: metalloregulator ArsR/SmtB family transcription factor [candidate division Zixibacteria bacterium]|nr:metalloregulator ArsR/SmtB family transcription factor [candidate division Zixibacteria bacterium]